MVRTCHISPFSAMLMQVVKALRHSASHICHQVLSLIISFRSVCKMQYHLCGPLKWKQEGFGTALHSGILQAAEGADQFWNPPASVRASQDQQSRNAESGNGRLSKCQLRELNTSFFRNCLSYSLKVF